MGRTRITRTDVATFAHVSKATVSYVINNQATERRISPQTVRRVMEAMRDLDYVPRHHAQALGRGGARTIGLLCDPGLLDRRWLTTCLLHARACGWHAGLCAHPASPKQLAEDLGARRYDGLVVYGKHHDRVVDPATVPTVRIDPIERCADPAVGWDREADCRALVQRLDPRPATAVVIMPQGGDFRLARAAAAVWTDAGHLAEVVALPEARGEAAVLGLGHVVEAALAAVEAGGRVQVLCVGDAFTAAAGAWLRRSDRDVDLIGLGLHEPAVLPPQAWGLSHPAAALASAAIDLLIALCGGADSRRAPIRGLILEPDSAG